MKRVRHPGLPVAGLVSQPPGDRDRAVAIEPDPALVVELVLEAGRAFEGEPPVGDATGVAVARLGEGPVVAEEDDPEDAGSRVVEPEVHAFLGRFVTEGRLVVLDQEVATLEPAERLRAPDRDAGAENAVPCLLRGLPGSQQRLEAPELRVRGRCREGGLVDCHAQFLLSTRWLLARRSRFVQPMRAGELIADLAGGSNRGGRPDGIGGLLSRPWPPRVRSRSSKRCSRRLAATKMRFVV